MSASEADDAQPLVSPELTVVRAKRMILQVTHERLLLRGRGSRMSEGELREATLRLFAELPHTPISTIDLVHEAQIPPEVVNWGTFADRMARTDAIAKLVPAAELAGAELQRTYEEDGALLNVVLEPSIQLEHGLYFRVHREYEVPDPEGVRSASRAMAILKAHWETSLRNATTLLEGLVAMTS